MRYTMRLTVDRTEGSLSRVLGLFDRRGWGVRYAVVRAEDEAPTMEVSLVVDGPGPSESFLLQAREEAGATRVEFPAA